MLRFKECTYLNDYLISYTRGLIDEHEAETKHFHGVPGYMARS